MRFGKRLALAIIRDEGEAPYLSQKELKHILVGLEKLCKSFAEQESLIAHKRLSHDDLVQHANGEREKYGLSKNNSILLAREIINHDASFIALIDRDIENIRKYVELVESDILEGLNDILKSAHTAGILSEEEKASTIQLGQDHSEIRTDMEAIISEFSRLRQYIEVNTAAIRKLLVRRRKNVSERFHSVPEYTNLSQIQSDESAYIQSTLDSLTALMGARPSSRNS